MTMTPPWPAPPAPIRSRNWLTTTLAAVAVPQLQNAKETGRISAYRLPTPHYQDH
ncbi:hypothetical protein [Mycolicibacter kumamotonensis]|uniref:hypothetical protein n=1 Tax=Mycolicibacter kumamotonensis TaxID=354243 RepID=UPI0013F4C50D|nr:hypothetical protein [Mycolicibacter kumamotonensis]